MNTFFYLAGRWTCALLSTGSVLLVYLIGRRLADRKVGLLAAALLAICPMAITEAHYSTVDDPLVFFLLCAHLVVGIQGSGYRAAPLLACCCGLRQLAMITKLPAVVMLLPLLFGALLLSDGSWRRQVTLAGSVNLSCLSL
ncbi:MAG: glycosyltransferase family 39 protein [Syntrophotaleaceae bacterium]